MSIRRSTSCTQTASAEIAIDMIARQLASIAPELRSAVCVAAMRLALKRQPTPLPPEGER